MIGDLIVYACGLAAIFLIVRNLTWAAAWAHGLHRHGWICARREAMELRHTVQWRMRVETIGLALIGAFFAGGWLVPAGILLFWILACRVVRFAQVKEPSWASILLLLPVAALVIMEGGMK